MYTRQRRLNLIIASMATTVFVVVSIITIIWVNGLHYDPKTGSFEQTAVIAVTPSMDGVTVKLNGKTVGDHTPIQLRDLAAGQYQLTIAKAGYHTYEEDFNLAAGQASVIRNLVLIAKEPQVTFPDSISYLIRSPFDVGLSANTNELWDNGQLITRFSTPLLQAHRFGFAYLYQVDEQLRLYFPESNQDFLVYTAKQADGVIKVNYSATNWTITIFDEGQPVQRIHLITTNEA